MNDLSNPIYTDDYAARKHLESLIWPNGRHCPHCGSTESETAPVRKRKKGSHRDGLYYCNGCEKQFTVTVGTVMESSHIPLHKWVAAFHLLTASKKGMSAHQLSRMLKLNYRSAWFLAHRVREAMKDDDSGPLGGEGKTVEVDETFIGQQGYEFHSDKGWQQKRGTGDMSRVMTLVERQGKARSIKINSLKARDIRLTLSANMTRDSNLMTDAAQHYKRVGKWFATHETVDHSKGEYGRGDVTTNTVEGFFSIFKRGMRGVYQHCGEQHLQRYLTEFDFRYSNRSGLGIEDEQRRDIAIEGAKGRRLTYRRIDSEETKA